MKAVKDMSETEKSAVLALLVGTSPKYKQMIPEWAMMLPGTVRKDHRIEDTAGLVHNLYDQENMHLAWRVLNWAWQNDLHDMIESFLYAGSWDNALVGLEPKIAQQRWLDYVLLVSIGMGLGKPLGITPRGRQVNEGASK